MHAGPPNFCILSCILSCVLEICSWPPSTAALASMPRGCHVTVVVVQHDGCLDVVVQNADHLRRCEM